MVDLFKRGTTLRRSVPIYSHRLHFIRVCCKHDFTPGTEVGFIGVSAVWFLYSPVRRPRLGTGSYWQKTSGAGLFQMQRGTISKGRTSSLHLVALDLLPAAFQPLLAQDTSPKSPAAPLAAGGPRRQHNADGVNPFLKNDVRSLMKISSLN